MYISGITRNPLYICYIFTHISFINTLLSFKYKFKLTILYSWALFM
nr:MAG TPA: hypothetical protein [Bacteriophage sp.]